MFPHNDTKDRKVPSFLKEKDKFFQEELYRIAAETIEREKSIQVEETYGRRYEEVKRLGANDYLVPISGYTKNDGFFVATVLIDVAEGKGEIKFYNCVKLRS